MKRSLGGRKPPLFIVGDKMVLKKEALCRIVVKDPSGKKQIWSGTVYKDPAFPDALKVVNNIKRALE
jgi:hypothetical protein